MALATFSDLKTAIAGWTWRTDITAQIPDFITLAEAEINRELRTSYQLVQATGTLDGEFVGLPAKFRMMRSLRLTSGTGRLLVEATPEQMAARKAVPNPLVAEPIEFCALNGQLELWPVPDRTYTAAMEYQVGLTPLSDAQPTNWILTDHPDAYLFGSLSMASAFVKNDGRATMFDQVFRRALGEIQEALRTSYDRTLRADAGLLTRPRDRTFNIISGD